MTRLTSVANCRDTSDTFDFKSAAAADFAAMKKGENKVLPGSLQATFDAIQA